MVTVNLEIPEADLNSSRFLIIYDQNCPLSERLFEAYSKLLPAARKVDYYPTAEAGDGVLHEVNLCSFDDLVILIQTSSFRMSNFRWRLELFNRGLRVIEHYHLGGNLPEEADIYLDTLRYDGEYFHHTANGLVSRIAQAKEIRVVSEAGAVLTYSGPFEEGKKNVGDFTGKKSKGCGFPIGEVFTELEDITRASGEMDIFSFADVNHLVVFPDQPFRLKVAEGGIVDDGMAGFSDEIEWVKKWKDVCAMIRSENPSGKIWLREIGLGLNKAVSKTRRLTDISAYERLCGIHVSLGLKHDVYRGKMPEGTIERYHVDIFPEAKQIWIDQEIIYENEKYLL